MNSSLSGLLLSEAPARGFEREMELYGRLNGHWRTSITYLSPRGEERKEEGDWTFGYALEGRAVIDVWQVPPRTRIGAGSGTRSRECGLCVRVYDPQLKLWRFTFHGPVHKVTIEMLAFAAGPDIVQERFDNGLRERWIFSDISNGRFSWRAVVSKDGGMTWELTQTVEAFRVVK